MIIPEKHTYTSSADNVTDWYMLLPPAKGTTWTVNLHGHGSNGDQIFTRPDIKSMWLPKIEKLGLGIVAPNLRDNAWMCPEAVQDLHDLLTVIRKEYKAERFILLSGSMGGTGSLIYSIRHPEDISAIVAMCPATDIVTYHTYKCSLEKNDPGIIEIRQAIEGAYGGSPAEVPARYEPHRVMKNIDKLTMPVYLCHGTADAAIPVEHSRKLYKALKERGNIEYTEIPDGDHDSPLENERMWEWLARTVNGGETPHR